MSQIQCKIQVVNVSNSDLCISIMVGRRFFKDMPQVALDKKSNMEYLEKEIGLKRFLPKSMIDSMKVRMIYMQLT